MFDDLFTQVVTHGVGIPSRGVQEALRPLGSHLTHSFGELPAVLTFQASEKTGEVAAGSLPDLWSVETVSDTGVQSSPRASGHRSMVANSSAPLRDFFAAKCVSSVG
jgi:hypothetical protein